VATLHIEHGVTSFAEWKSAFDRFAELRRQAGVRRHGIRRPVDDDHYVLIDLEFDTREDAEGLLTKMRQVWDGGRRRASCV